MASNKIMRIAKEGAHGVWYLDGRTPEEANRRVEDWADYLTEQTNTYAQYLNGDISKRMRRRLISNFRKRIIPVLVVTRELAEGKSFF